MLIKAIHSFSSSSRGIEQWMCVRAHVHVWEEKSIWIHCDKAAVGTSHYLLFDSHTIFNLIPRPLSMSGNETSQNSCCNMSWKAWEWAMYTATINIMSRWCREGLGTRLHVCMCVGKWAEYNSDLPLSSELLAALSPASLVRTSRLSPQPQLVPLLLDWTALVLVPQFCTLACGSPMSQVSGGGFLWSVELIDKNVQVTCVCVCMCVYVCVRACVSACVHACFYFSLRRLLTLRH